ncbi:MAG: hypothetical protein GY708_19760, partial [Actinomycetia bacterium]|nr:hypothetical protein [Actinomycetes bacterium]
GATVFANGLIDQNVIVDNVSSGARAILDLGATLTNVKVGRNNIIAGNTNDEISLTLIQGEFTDADATPSILGFDQWVTANTGGTLLTDLDDGVAGDRKTVLFGDSNTTVTFGSGLEGNGGVNFLAQAGDSMVCEYDGTDWLCVVSRIASPIGTFLDGDTTPNVSNYDTWKTNNTGGPHTITTFDNGVVGQTIKVLITDGATTIDFSGGG